jgi:hypothetical protein
MALSSRPISLWSLAAALLIVTLLVVNISVLFLFSKTQGYVKELKQYTDNPAALKESAIEWLTGQHINELKGLLDGGSPSLCCLFGY